MRPLLRHGSGIHLHPAAPPLNVPRRLRPTSPPLAGSPRLRPSHAIWDRLADSDLGVQAEHQQDQAPRRFPHRCRRRSPRSIITSQRDEAPHTRILVFWSNTCRLLRPHNTALAISLFDQTSDSQFLMLFAFPFTLIGSSQP